MPKIYLYYSTKYKYSSTTLETTKPQRNEKTKEHGEKEIWRKIRGEQVSTTARGRWRRQHRTELDGQKWSV